MRKENVRYVIMYVSHSRYFRTELTLVEHFIVSDDDDDDNSYFPCIVC